MVMIDARAGSAIRLLPVLLVLCGASSARAEGGPAPDPVGPEAFRVLRHFFDYDAGVPLEARVVERQEEPDLVREKVVFRGVGDSRVPGYLALPPGRDEPAPCVLLLHGIGGSKEDWWRDDSFPSGGVLTRRLLAAGYAVLALDAEYHGERLLNNDFESPMVFVFERGWLLRARDMIVQTVVEHRRALDYLETRTEVDASRVAVVGYSMGGMSTFMLSAVDPRVDAAVAAVPPILDEGPASLAIHNYAPYVDGPPFRMLVGASDDRNYTPEAARRVVALLGSETREITFYDSGHRLPVEWTDAATRWIETHLP